MLLCIALGACRGNRDHRLDGAWAVHFTLEKPYTDGSLHQPLSDTLTGVVFIDPGFPELPAWVDVPPEMRPYGIGRYFVDFGPFFGDPARPDSVVPRPEFETEEGSWLEVIARLRGRDSVYLDFTPRVADAGFSLAGRLRGDTIVGTWIQQAYCCGARGRFRMWRTMPSPMMDSAVVYAQRGVSRPAPEYNSAGNTALLPVVSP